MCQSVSPINLFLKVPKVKCPPARKFEFTWRPWIRKWVMVWSLDTTKEDCMQWAESSHHHIWYICNKWKFVVIQILSLSSQKFPFPYPNLSHIHSKWPFILGEKNKRQGKAYGNIFSNICVENVRHSGNLLGTAQCKMWLYSICHACLKFQNDDDFKQKT